MGRADTIGEMVGIRIKVLTPKFTQQESFRLQARNGSGEGAIGQMTSLIHDVDCASIGGWLDQRA